MVQLNKFLFQHSKSATIKQGREKEKLKMTHDKQLESLSHDLQKVSKGLCLTSVTL